MKPNDFKYYLKLEKTIVSNGFPRFFAMLALVLLGICNMAQGQNDYSGIYYIANKIWNGSNTSSPYYLYSYSTPEYNWYLVPARDPQLSHYSDAYFNDQYCNVNSGAVDYTGDHYGDPEKPFLTTYRTNRDNNSIWIIKKTTDQPNVTYYIIHALTGKYVKYQPPYKSFTSRKTMHLEAVDNDSPGDEFKFSISKQIEDNIEGFNIAPKNKGGNFFNPAGDNWPRYYGTNDGSKTPYSSGMIGLWTASGGGSLWPRENDARAALTPTFGDLNQANNTVTITCDFVPPSCQIVYTTDGTDPTVSTPNTCSSGDEIAITGTMTIKAAVVGYGLVLSNVATKVVTEFVLDVPVMTTTCDNKLEITCSNLPEGGTIRYAITAGDGSQADPEDPTSGSTLYEGILTVAVGTKVKAKAFYGSLESQASAVYTHAITHTDAPVITTTSTTEITITDPAGSTIYYTTNGVDPVIGASGVTSHATPVMVDFGGNMTEFRAIAKTSTLETSCVTRYVTMGPPTITIVTVDCSETSPRGNVIDIPIPSDGSTIWYAVTAGNNSAAPDINAIPNPYSQYTGPVVLDGYDGSNTHYTIHAYARSGDGHSAVALLSHEMQTGGKPVLTPPTGSNPVVVISGGVFGDKAVCSATGVADQEVSLASDGTAEYEISPEATGTLTVSFKHGSWQNSCATTFALPSAPATPTMSQDCADKLSLECESPMADIHYTIDGNEPTLSSPTYTPGCLDNLAFGTVVHAKAFDGFRSSEELVFTYQKLHSTPPQFFVEGTTVTISGDAGAAIYYNFSTNGDLTIPTEPADATTGSTLYSGNYKLTGITIFNAIAKSADKEPSCPVRVLTREGYSINSASDLNKLSQHTDKYFFVFNDINATGYTTTVPNFTGVIEGNSHTISNITKPLITNATNAVIHDLTLDNVNIDITTASTNVGAFACNANGSTRIYNCGITGSNSSVSGTQYVGGIVGFLDGSTTSDAPRVINCFSYADINGGTHRGGIVGYNNYASTSSNLRNMVMNCMFYGDISIDGTPTEVAPVYGGALIHNKKDNNTTGLNNYCYFYYNGNYLYQKSIPITYNGALGAEERFLNRFEFFRQTLNSTRNMAAYYVTNDVSEKDLIAKWVLKPDVAPYPILDAPGYYPSRVNLDAEHAVPIDPDNANYNKGRMLGTLTVKIEMGDGAKFDHPGTGADEAQIEKATLTLNVTDKDPDNFNFNYKKVQLPYYNQVGTKNYTGNRVVTGWKIVKVNGSTTGSGTFVNTGADYPAFNFADRACSNKDLYSVSGRVWNQGAYWEVPDGVTEITIQPYWAKAAYLSDAYYDMTYSGLNKYGVTVAGSCPTTFDGQAVNNTVSAAITNLAIDADATVYDYAVVLVGNYHQYANSTIFVNIDNKPATFMSADVDGDCEPDNTLFYYHNKRQRVAPIRFDFLNMPGIGMVKRTHDSGIKPEPGIFKPTGWFEVTNTVNLYCGQFEYCDGNSNDNMQKIFEGPLILQGGIYQQFVSSFKGDAPDLTPYIHVGGNAWFMNFANGCHTNTYRKTHNMPITVTGGDYEHFYLTGIYRPDGTPDPEDAECYIDGGRFGEVAGAGMQLIDGNVTWVVNGADIESFFGGGINAAKSITGNITTTIKNSRVTEFYGGPKFGDMKPEKVVTTTATNCKFGLFFGAGYGGTAFNKYGHEDATIPKTNNTAPWNSYVTNHYLRNYSSDSKHPGISTSYAYEYILFSDGEQTVARFFVNYASLSLASTQDVVSTLDGCEIGKFYGGGRLGAVYGNVSSTLTDCTVIGDAFGSGFSAEAPTVMVMDKANFVVAPEYNRAAGVFNDAQVVFPAQTQYRWSNEGTNSSPFIDEGETHLIHTETSLEGLGAVYGNATLTIQGNSEVMGDVYGGGAKSSSNTGTSGGTCTVNILGGTYGVKDGEGNVTHGNIYGGGMGDLASLATEEDPDHKDVEVTEDVTVVNIGSSEQEANNVVIYGSVFGCNNINGTPQGDATVHIWKTKHDANNVVTNLTGGHALNEVFGGGNKAHYLPTTTGKKATVHVHNCDNTIKYVYGGGNAADVGASGEGVKSETDVIIDGGRILWLFGGGNGYSATDNHGNPGEPNYNPGANVYGNTNVTYHAGDITYLFGGSNEYGVVSGSKNMSLANDASCSISNHIAELYGGNNKADIDGNVEWAMACTSTPCQIDYLFGGSRMANISGDVTLTVNGGLYNYVFGGNNLGGIIDGNVTLNLYGGTINQAAFGGNKGGPGQQEYDYFKIIGDITVNVEDHCPDCPLQVNNVFGAGDQASYIAPTDEGAREHNPMVNVKNLCSDKTITGNVYGGGNGLASDLSQMTGSVTGKPMVTIGDLTEGHEDYRAAISGNVFGGGNAAKVVGNTEVLMQKANSTVGGDIYGGGALANTGSTTVTLDGGTVTQDIYGGGLGDNTHAAVVDGTAQVTVNGGTVRDVFGCNNLNGAPTGAVVVDINSNVARNVYGGGNQAPYTGVPDVNINSGVVSGSVFGGGNQAGVAGGDVTMIGGQVLTGIYGGCNTSGTVSGDIAVNINAGTVGADADHKANIHGGGYGPATKTGGNVEVTINQADGENPPAAPVIWGDIYGGSALGSVNSSTDVVNALNHTYVTLTKGTVHGAIYGGGLGQASPAVEAKVWSPVQVTVNGGTVDGSVYGCNNINGAPQSTVKVDIYGTDAPLSGYALGHVFGGGNQAAYGGTPVVTVHNCANSIEYVYGGGNAANVSGTDVTIYGGNTIGKVFGGCYGANVTTGGTNVKIYGGTIGQVYGGNNQSGTITGPISLNVNKQAEGSDPACAMKIGELYGGGNKAGSAAGTITIGCTGTLVDLGTNEHYGVHQEGIQYVYGGANQANISSAITLNITSGIVENVFGGNNHSGDISSGITVNINKNESSPCASDWYVGNVFGGGNQAPYTGVPDVNIQNGTVSGSIFGGGNEAGVGGGNVEMTGGTVLGSIYGGCNTSGVVDGNISVQVKGGTLGSSERLVAGTLSNLFGGGYGESTSTTGNVTVTVTRASGVNPPAAPIIWGDVYGGSALGSVNNESGDKTVVNILDGTLKSNVTMSGLFKVYNGGNVYGGGLGEEGAGNVSKGQVNGVVTVNVGSKTENAVDVSTGDKTGNSYSGNATIEGNVYGCNNTNGSPQQNVTVNIYMTAHHEDVDYIGDDGFAIANVFGGGNRANFTPAGKTTTVNIWGCDNTIGRTFGGGNAAATNTVTTTIRGGRFGETYGGGNGEVDAADINGHILLNIYGGTIGQSFLGSNQNGTISESGSMITINNSLGCGGAAIDEQFCGSNFSNHYGDIDVTMQCSDASGIRNLYGGCKQADVLVWPSVEEISAHLDPSDNTYPNYVKDKYNENPGLYASNFAGKGGNVHLTVEGGIYENVYGGSQGRLANTDPNNPTAESADIVGNVQLDIYGGTITNAIYGGSHILGSIGGTVIVNVEDKYPDDACALDVSTATVYGGGNQADYTAPVGTPNYPEVNIKNATVKAVFGGALEARVTGNPQVRIKNKAKVLGNVYGGGNMGVVDGNPKVVINGKWTAD